jgi:uncharacterized protein YndB with AHSA1/START domain
MTDLLASRLGRLTIDGDYATITFERRLPHAPQVVWQALTEGEQLADWYLTSARIDGRVGGTIDFWSSPARVHVTGRILEWDPPHVFEHEWITEPRPELPKGESGVIRWELSSDGDATLLKMTHSHLTRPTAQTFLSGAHAFLDRLESQLDESPLPDWMGRTKDVQKIYLERQS